MPTITAAQHFFSSVAAAQSPVGRRGYQTVARTPALPADAVAAIEDRAQYATAPGDPFKRQFYPLPGRLAAVSQIVPLAEPDEFGRKGRYLAHTLVFDRAAYAALEYCLLDVLAQFHFLATLDEVFRQSGPGRGQAPAITFDVAPVWRQQALADAARWPLEGLAVLGRTAWRAAELAGRREPVLVIGTDTEQLRLFGLCFLLAAPSQRLQLSFDTRVEGCNFGLQTTFWAHGYAEPPRSDFKHLLDARPGGHVRSGLPLAGDGPYAIWMLKDALPAGLAAALPQQSWAAALEEVLVTGQPIATTTDPRKALPDAFVERFARLNAQAITERWLAALPQGLSPDLSQTLAARLRVDPGHSLRLLIEGLYPHNLFDFLCTALLELARTPAATDRKILEPWLLDSQHAALATFPPFWAGDEKAWPASLAELPLDDYAALLAGLANWPTPPIPLWKALPQPERRKLPFLKATRSSGPPIEAERAAVWVSAAGCAVAPGDWDKTLPALAEAGEPALDAVADIFLRLSVAAQRAIAAWMKSYRGDAHALRAALAAQRNAQFGQFNNKG